MEQNEYNNNRNIRPFWIKIIKWFKARTSRYECIIPASEAYSKVTYGGITNAEDQIRYHQHEINSCIKNKIMSTYDRNIFSYRCVYSFPDNMKPYIKDVLQVFIDNGYQVINLSQKVEELKSDNVYLISWYREKL